jgi:hypothetical protein
MFPRGRLLWLGLSSMHRFVETYFTGGGLMRPMGARALAELVERTGDGRLQAVAARYHDLGSAWTSLAAAALPDGVPLLAETRRLQTAPGDPRGVWARLSEIERAADDDFPLDDAAVLELRRDLAARLRDIHAAEVAALEELRAALAP